MKKVWNVILIFCLVFCLCGCELTDTLTDSDIGTTDDVEQQRVTTLENLSFIYFDDKGLHPLMDSSLANQKVHTVVYEPAFTLDEDMNIIYGCAAEVTVDGTHIAILPDTGRHFSDGTRLSAELMAKCYRYVLENPSSPYYRQLSGVENVYAQGGKLHLTLGAADESVLYGLDIPIVYEKDGAYYGCGDYMISKYRDEPALVVSPYAKTQPLMQVITLLDPSGESSLASMFDSGVLSVLPTDIMKDGSLSAGREYQSVEYLTDTMLYVGINVQNNSAAWRRAVSAMIPRKDIVESVLMGDGVATARPFYPLWSKLPEETVAQSDKTALIERFTSAGLKVENGELYTADGEKPVYEIVVCEDTKTHIAAAEKIRSAGQALGLQFDVVSVDADTFAKRLKNGNFDLYIARFDLNNYLDATDLFETDGSYNYGGVSLLSLDKAHVQLMAGEITVEEYLTQFERECPILPIAFIKNELCYTEGVSLAGKISSSNPLGDPAGWKVE